MSGIKVPTQQQLAAIKKRADKTKEPDDLFGYGYLCWHSYTPALQKEGVKYLRKAADAGHASAWGLLGDAFSSGIGVTKNKDKAMSCYLKSAELGSAEGYFSAGMEYMTGGCAEKDEAKAYEYISKAAEMGSSRAFNTLGIMYLIGIHVQKDREKAKENFEKAAEMGSTRAIQNLKNLENNPDIDFTSVKVEALY